MMAPPHHRVDNATKIADFAELQCLKQADWNISASDVSRILNRGSDVVNQDEEEELSTAITAAFDELAVRVSHCGGDDGRYPFSVSPSGRLLTYNPNRRLRRRRHEWYLFLLFATHEYMKSRRRKAGHDGTVLFERLCEHVSERFLGGPGAQVKTHIFGTGRLVEEKEDDEGLDETVFGGHVKSLCQHLGEGVGFPSEYTGRVTARDGKLDVVAWRSFSDKRGGQLIGFGQCKTGTHWQSDLAKLRPDDFCAKWMIRRPAVLPFRIYFIADRVVDRWHERAVDGGIVFDRCRVIEYSHDLSGSLRDQITEWVDAAAAEHGLRV